MGYRCEPTHRDMRPRSRRHAPSPSLRCARTRVAGIRAMIHSLYRRAGLGNRLRRGERRHRLVQEIAGSDSDPNVARLHALLPRQQVGIPRRVQRLETEVFETALNYWRPDTIRFVNRRFRARSGGWTDGLLATAILRAGQIGAHIGQCPDGVIRSELVNAARLSASDVQLPRMSVIQNVQA